MADKQSSDKVEKGKELETMNGSEPSSSQTSSEAPEPLESQLPEEPKSRECVLIGIEALAEGFQNVVIGIKSSARGNNNLVIGDNNIVEGNNNVVLASRQSVVGNNLVIVGESKVQWADASKYCVGELMDVLKLQAELSKQALAQLAQMQTGASPPNPDNCKHVFSSTCPRQCGTNMCSLCGLEFYISEGQVQGGHDKECLSEQEKAAKPAIQKMQELQTSK